MFNTKTILYSVTTMAVIGFIAFTLYNQGIFKIADTTTVDTSVALSAIPVEIKDLQQYDELEGILEYGKDFQIKPSGNGILTSIATEGSELERGSLIFTFHSPLNETSLMNTTQQITSASVSVAQAKLALENLQKPASKSQIASADASIAQAKLALENLTNPATAAQLASADSTVAQSLNNLESNKEQLQNKTTALRIARKNYCDQTETLGITTWATQKNICPEDGFIITESAVDIVSINIFKHDNLVTLSNSLLTAYSNYQLAIEAITTSEVSLNSAQEQRTALQTQHPTEKQLDQVNKSLESALQHRSALDETPSDDELASALASLESALQHRLALDETPSDAELASALASLENAKTSLLTAETNKENLYKTTGTFGSILMFGQIHPWREIKLGVTPGQDIKQLKYNLSILGYGTESHTNVSGEIFTTSTEQSLKDLQSDLGLNPTGALPLGDVVFLLGKSVVQYDANFPSIGTEVSSNSVVLSLLPIEQESSLSNKSGVVPSFVSLQKVSTSIPVVNKDLIEVDSQVKIELPNEIEVYGSVSDIGKTAIIPEGNQASDPYLEVSITINDDQSFPEWTGAEVIVYVTREIASAVMAVPVTSLVSVLDGGYGLEVVTNNATQLVPVEVGMHSGGWVEVSSEYIKEGTQVMNPK